MFYEKIDNDLHALQLFPAFITIHRISQIVIATGWTGFGLKLVFDRFSASRAKFGPRGQIFMASGALIENDLLMPALMTKFSINRYRIVAFGTGEFLLCFLFPGLR